MPEAGAGADPIEARPPPWLTAVGMLPAFAGLWLAIVLFSLAARAEPPAGADPNSPTAQFYRSLRQPTTGRSCCSVSDCRPTDYRLGPKEYEVPWKGAWVTIPAELVLHQSNTLGIAIWCRSEQGLRAAKKGGRPHQSI